MKQANNIPNINLSDRKQCISSTISYIYLFKTALYFLMM